MRLGLGDVGGGQQSSDPDEETASLHGGLRKGWGLDRQRGLCGRRLSQAGGSCCESAARWLASWERLIFCANVSPDGAF